MFLDIFVVGRRTSGRSDRHALTMAIAGLLIGILAGCVSDQRQVASPRDLLPDVSLQPDLARGPGTGKVGVLLPLSGPHSEIGQQMWDAAMLSLFDHGRDDIQLVPFDTQGTPDGAMKAAEAAALEGSAVVVGPLFSSSVSAARPILAAHGVRGIGLSNNRAVAGDPFFLIGSHPELQVDAIVAYLQSKGKRRIKLLGPDTPYLQILHNRLTLLDKAGKIRLVDTRLYRTSASYTDIAKDVRAIALYDRRARALKEFTSIFARSWKDFDDPEEALQIALEKISKHMEKARLQAASFTPDAFPERKTWSVTEAEYSDALADMLRTYRRQLKVEPTPKAAMQEAIADFERRETLGKPDFDAVLLPIGDKPLLVIAPMFEYFNAAQPDIWLVGTDIWESTVRTIPKDLIGGRYVTVTAPAWSDFQARFQKTFGIRPDPLTAAVYDAIGVAISEKRETGRTTFDTAYLTRPAGFDGVNGTFRFLADGTNERTLHVMAINANNLSSVFAWDPQQQFNGPQPTLPVEADKVVPAQPGPQATPPLTSMGNTGKRSG